MQRSLGRRSSSHERADEIPIDAPVADGPIGPEAAQSKLAARLVEVQSDLTSGRREPNTFIRLLIDMKRAYTRFDEALTQTIQLLCDTLRRHSADGRSRPLAWVRLELGRQAIAGRVEDEGHAPPARIVPDMSPPVGARNAPKQLQCLYVVDLRRVRAKMLLK